MVVSFLGFLSPLVATSTRVRIPGEGVVGVAVSWGGVRAPLVPRKQVKLAYRNLIPAASLASAV